MNILEEYQNLSLIDSLSFFLADDEMAHLDELLSGPQSILIEDDLIGVEPVIWLRLRMSRPVEVFTIFASHSPEFDGNRVTCPVSVKAPLSTLLIFAPVWEALGIDAVVYEFLNGTPEGSDQSPENKLRNKKRLCFSCTSFRFRFVANETSPSPLNPAHVLRLLSYYHPAYQLLVLKGLTANGIRDPANPFHLSSHFQALFNQGTQDQYLLRRIVTREKANLSVFVSLPAQIQGLYNQLAVQSGITNIESIDDLENTLFSDGALDKVVKMKSAAINRSIWVGIFDLEEYTLDLIHKPRNESQFHDEYVRGTDLMPGYTRTAPRESNNPDYDYKAFLNGPFFVTGENISVGARKYRTTYDRLPLANPGVFVEGVSVEHKDVPARFWAKAMVDPNDSSLRIEPGNLTNDELQDSLVAFDSLPLILQKQGVNYLSPTPNMEMKNLLGNLNENVGRPFIGIVSRSRGAVLRKYLTCIIFEDCMFEGDLTLDSVLNVLAQICTVLDPDILAYTDGASSTFFYYNQEWVELALGVDIKVKSMPASIGVIRKSTLPRHRP